MKKIRFLQFAESRLALICLVLLLSLSLLGGCGGGGSDGPAPGPSPTADAIEAWSGNWSGTGSLSALLGQEGGTPETITVAITLTSGLVARGSGVDDEAMTVTLDMTAETQALGGDVTITLTGGKAVLFGKENAEGDLEVEKASLTEGTGSLLFGDKTYPFDVKDSTQPIEIALTEPLLLTNTGFYYEFGGTAGSVDAEGELEGTLSGNSATIKGSGAGAWLGMGNVEDLTFTLNMTR